ASGWWVWWRSLQPQARCTADGVLSRPEGLRAEVWEDLAKTHGRNGMLLVAGCLLWWGDAAAVSEEVLLLEDWKKVVEDVSWV
ncbi:hypothetical protein B0H13DRAFT_1447665, partial [Mycena leptocephala]